ncbi:MAG: ATP phosphoribosyltransferase regulatory subunit [Trueperaceae bacterium]
MTQRITPPDGTRFTLPDEASSKTEVITKLQKLYYTWGYRLIDVPAIETYDPNHPRAHQSFKFADQDGGVLALRSDFTPALSQMVRGNFADDLPQRLQYSGDVWQAVKPDFNATREFTQIGLELIGVSNARADAELIHLARESLRTVGLKPRVELGNPSFVKTLFDLAGIDESKHNVLADAIDRKDQRTLQSLLEPLKITKDLHHALLTVVDLYGDIHTLERAHKLAPWPEATRELERLDEIIREFEDSSELLLDLGMARRLSYYTGMTFRAYTFDFGQALIGGGRYDGALLPYAAGFSLGLERLMRALPKTEAAPTLVLSLEDAPARLLRKAGYSVERSLTIDVEEAKRYAAQKSIAFLLTAKGLEPLVRNHPFYAELLLVLGEKNV